jgi:hypothetical protein
MDMLKIFYLRRSPPHVRIGLRVGRDPLAAWFAIAVAPAVRPVTTAFTCGFTLVTAARSVADAYRAQVRYRVAATLRDRYDVVALQAGVAVVALGAPACGCAHDRGAVEAVLGAVDLGVTLPVLGCLAPGHRISGTGLRIRTAARLMHGTCASRPVGRRAYLSLRAMTCWQSEQGPLRVRAVAASVASGGG